MSLFGKGMFICLVLVCLSGVSAASEKQLPKAEKKDSADLSSVLLLIAQKLQLIEAKNTTVIVSPSTVNATIVVLPSTVNVTAGSACVSELPRRGIHYFESPLSVQEDTTIVLPLPNGECTVLYGIGQPNGLQGSIEAFDGFTATQTKLCDPNPSAFCAHKVTISNAYPFARVVAKHGATYPTVIVSYSCV